MNALLNPIFAHIFEALRYPKADDVPDPVENMTPEEYMELHEPRLGFDHSDSEFIDANEAMWNREDER